MTSLSTERLILAPWGEEHKDEWIDLYTDTRVTQNLGTGEPIPMNAIVEEFDWMTAHWTKHGFGWRIALDKQTGTWAGVVGVNHVNDNPSILPVDAIEFGWWFKPDFWGGGLATEAAMAIRDDTFANNITDRLWARHTVRNAASGRIMDRLGMMFVGEATGTNGVAMRIYDLTRDRWKALTSA